MNLLYRKELLQMIRKATHIEDMIKVFDPFPLQDSEAFDNFYVDTYEARGENAVRRMAFGLKISLNPYYKILFMGHRGSGKSTELFLLEKEIKSDFEVISFFIEDLVDVGTMTYIDFIFAIMSKLVSYIETHPDLGLTEDDIKALYNYWHEEKIIEEIVYDSDEMSAGFDSKLSFLKLISVTGGGILKTGSESKTLIRRKLEPTVGHLIQLVNQIIEKINSQLPNKGLIFIIEDLDKLTMDVAQGLFINYRRVILSLQTRMILTFPIYMAYNAQYNMIKEDVDMCQMLSVIKVTDRQKEAFETGINKLKEIVFKRAEQSLFSDEALSFLIMKSGGAIRDLFQMIRDAAFEALMVDHEKIEFSDAQTSYSKLKSEYERLIRSEEDVKKLKLIYFDSRPLTTDDIVMSLLLRGLILEYNGERWCGVHPAIEDFLREKGELCGK